MSDEQNEPKNDASFGTANTGGGSGDDSPEPGANVPTPAPTPATDLANFFTTQRIVYGLYALSFLVGPAAIAGLIVAYLVRADAPAWLQTHYTYLIRTFWISLVYFVIALTSILIFVAPVLLMAVVIWFLVRVVLGWMKMEKGEPIANPQSWWLGK